MITKAIEIRDRSRFIPAILIKPSAENEGQRYLLARAGFLVCGGFSGSNDQVILMELNYQKAHCDPYDWTNQRTYAVAHDYCQKHFDEIKDGDVIDVEFILSKKAEKKKSERFHE